MNVVIKVNDEIKQKMIEYYKDKKRDKVIPYVVFQAEEEDTVITMYESGKVMFQGKSADVDAAMWGVALENTKEKQEENKKNDEKYYNTNAVGSDEVGTGDYFGPIVVTATYVKKEDIPYLESLGVGDSKKIDDSKILKIAPEIAKRVKYRSIILSNKEYNEKYAKDINMNKIKAVLHNKVLTEMVKDNDYDYIVVDQFEPEKSYYNHLSDVPNPLKGITFITKAEDKCLSVAVSSLISRYIFIKEMDKLGDKYGIFLPKGANYYVEDVGIKLVNKYGEKILHDIAKLNFSNTDRILKEVRK